MGAQLTIESPSFDRIRKLDGPAIEDAIRLLWYVANNQADVERRDIQIARNSINNAVLHQAPTTHQHNFDLKGAGVGLFTGGVSFTLTGIRNGNQGALRILANLGAGIITIAHESGSSDAPNRITTATGANKTIGPGKFMLLEYLNLRWREVSLA